MRFPLLAFTLTTLLSTTLAPPSLAADYPPNIDYGSTGDFIAKRGTSHGRTANLTALGPVLINIPEGPGSSDAGLPLESFNTAWDLSDLTNPTLIAPISSHLTQPIAAHATVFRFDTDHAYVYTRGSEVNNTTGDFLRFDPSGNSSVEQLISHPGYLFDSPYRSAGFGEEPFAYSMMTSPYFVRSYWEYGFDPSGTFGIRDPARALPIGQPEHWLGEYFVDWDHLGTTGVTGFTSFLGDLMVVASDQQSTGMAIYDISGYKQGQAPQLLSVFNPVLSEPNGNTLGIGGYWVEPYGANKMVWAAREHHLTPTRNYPAMYVVDFSDPTSPELTCEIYFDQNQNDAVDGDHTSDPMYVNFQDQYAYVDHFKVDIDACETAYQNDQQIDDTEFSQIVFRFGDRENVCDGSQYFRALGQVGVFGGYDFFGTQAVITYSGATPMTERHGFAEINAWNAYVDAGRPANLFPVNFGVSHHLNDGTAVISSEHFEAGMTVIDFYNETDTFQINTVTIDENINEQGMCFMVTSDEPDTHAPYVSGHRPLAGQTHVPIDSFISIHIPETLRVETVTQSLTVTNLSTNEPIAFKQQLSHTGTLAIWPEQDMDLDVSYQVNVSGIQDFMGNTMEPYSFTFTTGVTQYSTPSPEPLPPAPSYTDEPYYPNHSGQIACTASDDGYDSIWAVNPDNDTLSTIVTYTDTSTFEQTHDITEDAVVYSDGKPSSVTQINDWLAVTFSDTDKIRYYRLGWWGTSPYTAWGTSFDYGDRPVASVAHGDMLYVALYGSGEIAKIDTVTRQIVGRLAVGSKPKAMALTADGSRLLVTRFISNTEYAEVYDINTAGSLSFRDPSQPSIRINKILVPDDIDHGSGIPNYLRSIVIDANEQFAYITANKANIDRGQYLNGQSLDDDNTIRPMIAIIDLVNHRDTNINPSDRNNTIDLDNSADPAAITFLPDGITRAHSLQGNNVVELHNLELNTTVRTSTGFAPQSMCTTLRTLYVKNHTDRSVSAIDIANFMHDGRNNPNVQTLATVAQEQEVLSEEELTGLQLFYHARTPDISPEGYISCASCHDDGGHDGMTWDLSHMGEGLRNTISLRGTSGTRFGPLHWSSNFDEVQDFEIQMEQLNGGEGLILGVTFTGQSPLAHTTEGSSDELDALAAYVSSLGKESVLRSPNSCVWGGLCDPLARSGGWQYYSHSCGDCHTGSAFRDGQSHDMGTITEASGQRLGLPLTEIRTPTLIGLWDSAPYLHDGSADTLEDVLTRGEHANYGLDDRERTNLIEYLLNIDQLDFIEDDEPFNP